MQRKAHKKYKVDPLQQQHKSNNATQSRYRRTNKTMKTPSSMFLLAFVPTLVLKSSARAAERTEFSVRRRRAVEGVANETEGSNKASGGGKGGWTSAPARDESTLSSSTRVWVQFNKEISHPMALGLVQAKIMTSLGATEKDATDLLVPDAGARAANSTAAYPFKLHYDFYESEVPFMVMTVDQTTLRALKADPNVASVEVDRKRFPTREVKDDDAGEWNRQWQQTDTSPRSEYTPLGITMAKADEVWALGYKGQGVAVCVIDTGLDFWHPEWSTEEWLGFSGAGEVSSGLLRCTTSTLLSFTRLTVRFRYSVMLCRCLDPVVLRWRR
jgi:hypothetical protein